MVRLLAVILTCAIAFCPGAAAQNAASPAKPAMNVAGKVELVEGDVTIYDRARAARKIRVGEALYEGDGVVTGRDGELHVAMDDGGYLAVRPNTMMDVLAYQAHGRNDDRSVLNLVAGSFRSITGWIGRHNPRAYQVRTQTATIGIRGTDHEPMVIPEGFPGGEAGTYDKVNAGGTYIESTLGHGRVEVAPNRAGFAPLRGRPAPRLLAEVPRVYRPTRNEQRLFNKHQAAQQSSGRLRADRRRDLDERRKAQQERKDAPKSEPKRERRQNGNDAAQREDLRAKRPQDTAQQRNGVQGERRNETGRTRDSQQPERRIEERRQRSDDEVKSKADTRRREPRDDAPRGRNRDSLHRASTTER